MAALAVPSFGITIDLTTAGATGSSGAATFTQTELSGAGSGSAGSFLRIQGSPTEQGYNTGGGTVFDTKAGVSLNNGDLSVSNFANGASVFLDINEPAGNGQNTLTLTALRIYTNPVHNLTTTDLAALGTVRYDFGVGNELLLDANLAPGSGNAGVLITFDQSVFAGAAPTDAVYLYAAFGGTDDAAAAGGFEEFLLIPGTPGGGDGGEDNPGGGETPAVPEPASLALLPLAIGALGLRRRMAR